MAWTVAVEALQSRQLGLQWVDVATPPVVRPGEHHALVAPCATGKTAIAHALGAVGQGRTWRGTVRREGDVVASVIPSSPDLVFSGIAETLNTELRLGESRDPLLPLGEVVGALGIQHLLGRDPFTLSGGQRAMAALAVMMCSGSPILVLDQAVEWLDVQNRTRVETLLARWCRAGGGVVELAARSPLGSRGGPAAGAKAPGTPSPHVAGLAAGPALRVEDLRFAYPSGGFAIGPVTFEVPRGLAMALVGPNGAGKTTLLRCLAHLLLPVSGRVSVHDSGGAHAYAPRLHHLWARKVRLVHQNPDDQLYLPTVRAELGDAARLDRVVERFGLSVHLDRSPFDLPRPLRRLLTIATALTARPAVLLLDEPTAWLDEAQVSALTLELSTYTTDGGAVVFISHDAAFVEAVTDRTLHLSTTAKE